MLIFINFNMTKRQNSHIFISYCPLIFINYFDIFLEIEFYLAFQTPAVVAHLARNTPLGSDRLIKLLTALVKYFLSYRRAITLTFDLRVTRLLTTSSCANVIIRDHLLQMTTLIGRLSWLIIKPKNKFDT